MEPLHLFNNLAMTSGENALTEALAATLKKSLIFRRAFLSWANTNADGVVIETQPPRYLKGRPDLQIKSATHLILFEVKMDAPLKYDQWHRYRQILKSQTQVPHKHLIGIVTPWTDIEDEILALRPPPKIWQWSDVYRIAQKASKDELDAVAVSFDRRTDGLPRRTLHEAI